MNSSMMMATSGEPRICTTAAWLRPSTHHDHDEGDGERHVGDRGQALAPEMLGAGLGRAKAADAPERRAHLAATISAALP